MSKKWIIAPQSNNEYKAKFKEINPIVLQLLFNRGLTTQDQVDQFLGPDYNRDQHDPFLFSHMKPAVSRILNAVSQGQKIVIYGDYDADGVTSTAVLYNTLKRLQAENIGFYIPDRINEGYGMNTASVRELAKQGANLVITVDCGISNFEEIELAKKLGMDVIVTDHHTSPEKLPPADHIICPTVKTEKYPFSSLAGVGVAFKLAQALLRTDQSNNEAFEKWLLDLVAIGTVADCMPLLGENRTLVKWGLLVLNKTERLGLQELIQASRIKRELDSHSIGFQLAPRLNAAGRMDHANTALELLITEDEAEALAIATDLGQKNQHRQQKTEDMLKISLSQIGEPKHGDKILFSSYQDWSPGLVGLVAGKLADKFSRPVIVFGRSGDKYIGSGRSIPEFDITAALNQCQQYLSEFGGHSQACGLTIKGEQNFNQFKQAIYDLATGKLAGVELAPSIQAEAVISLSEANWDLVDNLAQFAPFGEANEEPLFITRNLIIESMDTIGNRNNHLRLYLKDNTINLAKKFLAFGQAEEWRHKAKPGDRIDVVYSLSINQWNGSREIQFKIKDIKKSK